LDFRNEAQADATALFAGPGEVRSHARELDWSKSPLGPTTKWSPAVRTLARSIFDSPFPICLWSGPEYALVYNDAYRRILTAKHPAALGQPGSIVWAEIWGELEPQFDGVRKKGETVYFEDAPFVMARLEGGGTETAWFNYSLSPLRDEDGSVAAVLNITPETTARVLVERKLADEQAALAKSEAYARLNVERVQLALAAGAIIGTWHWDLLSDRFTVDEAFARSFGLDPALGREGIPLAQIVATVHPDDQAGLAAAIDEARLRGGPYAHQYRTRRADGNYYWLEANGRVDKGPGGTSLTFPGVLIDVEKRRADEAERLRVTEELRRLNETLEQRVADRTAELMRMEDALRQAQKMEAVGQLTGGLAHDFNNLLAGISGSLELMQTRMQQGRFNDVERYMAAAQGAAKRAAALTHRLLAFSRRQTLDPKPTNVNRLVTGMQEMIQRTVGPSIAVEAVGAGSLWPVLVDPSQLENSLLNLCLNSRDAMPNGGRITIETANRWLDERTAKEHDVPEGQYLSLCVTDTGAGMAPDVIARVFEPFYTTKPIGEGTGLGLSMIYGFAKQSGGQVRIYSEVGKGTTVCIYLPRHYGEVEDEGPPTEPAMLPRSQQGETVLVVDDEPTVRMLITDILDELGLTAIEASDSAAGLKVLQSDVRIDLLVTDVGLPGGMNGRQMADAGRVGRPNLKVLFITGYAENAAVGNGQLAPGMAVLTKPFPVETMAARIRSMIEAGKEQQRPAVRKS
jgi:signal transduction histidine kinase/ActR/RegA family two-component response regulator